MREGPKDETLQVSLDVVPEDAEPSDLNDPREEEAPWEQFDDDLFGEGRSREQMTWCQKRANKYAWRARQGEIDGGSGPSLDLTAEKLQGLQEGDETLAAARQAAHGEVNSAGQGFFLREGLLYCRWEPLGNKGDEETVEQLVLPESCRPAVLRLAHAIPLAGHMGKRKTAHQLLQRFYWPSLYRDVTQLIRSCAECQKVSPRRVKPAPLIPPAHHGGSFLKDCHGHSQTFAPQSCGKSFYPCDM